MGFTKTLNVLLHRPIVSPIFFVDENPQILSKFYDTAFTPGEEINLTCSLEISETPAVSWYRNEELVSDGSRVSIKIFGNGTTLTIFSAKPYDAGIYKCIVRSKGGKATAAARVLVGGR